MPPPIRVVETGNSRKFELNSNDSRATWEFEVLNAFSYTEQQIYDAVNTEANAPHRWQSMIKQSLSADPKGGGVWVVTIGYQRPAGYTELPGQGGPIPPNSPPSPGQPATPGETEPLNLNASFETARGQQRIFQSVKTMSKHAAAGDVAPDYQGAIGVTDKGVEGVELPHQAELSLTLTFDLPYITRQYIKNLGALVDCVNKETWWGFPAHTVLFNGANGSYQPSGRWSISYKFGLATAETDKKISDDITIPTKRGFDYVWVSYKPALNANQLVQQPFAAYVEQVYKDKIFFDHLGFGA